MPKKTSGTYWVIPMNRIQMFRGTFMSDGTFETARGGHPTFDPATALYVTGDMMTNLCDTYNIAIFGGVASATAFQKVAEKHAWKSTLTLDQAIAHPHLGRTMPKRELIIQAAMAHPELVIEG